MYFPASPMDTAGLGRHSAALQVKYMSENHYCYCPHCNAIFRLSEENLNRESTLFRCGVCREVFDSSINSVEKTETGFTSLPVESPGLQDKEDKDMTHPPRDSRDPPEDGARIIDGVTEPLMFGDSIDIDADNFRDPVEDRSDFLKETPFVRKSLRQPVHFDEEKTLEKLPVQPVLEEVPLDWRSKNTAHEYIKDRSKPLATLVWFMASVGLMFLLSLQVKYFYVDKFAQDQSLRKYLAGFCKIASCELPPLKSPDLFALTYTKIDPHPNQPDALRVTVKLFNKAAYSQPYPDLRITLSDRAGRIVGRRSFRPDSYLATGSENMVGEGELISLLFDLARPHEKAVGFAVDIVTD